MTRYLQRSLLLVCIILGLSLGACGNAPPSSATTAESPPATLAPASTPTTATADPTSDLAALAGMATVSLQVNGGQVLIEVDGEHAPITAGNFVDLVERGIYDGSVFHRVIREPDPFVVQGGDPQSVDPTVPQQRLGTGSFIDPATDQARFIPLEIQPEETDTPAYNQTFDIPRGATPPVLKHSRGAVAMARSQPLDSASAQFYITLADLPFLDGNYAVFGYVTEGMDVVDGIQQGDVLETATVVEGADNLKTAG
ncbi:MAG: peptidylprolyl isomerase [Leptolyngbya sp. RL_3_1]|nr:peptidylprolyl isomerase [Leptolyngbya sp. RL_3_1]